MSPIEQLAFIKELLDIIDKHDATSDLFWRKQPDGSFCFYINCNDLFYWATADAEDVTPADLETLDQAYTDADTAGGEYFGAQLYAARRRQMRPQAPYFQYFNDNLVELFKAAGPPREEENDERIAKYLERRNGHLRGDPGFALSEEARHNARRYLKEVTMKQEITVEEKRHIAELLGLDHAD